MELSAPLVSERERASLVAQGIDSNILAGARFFLETGNWDELLPDDLAHEDRDRLKGVIATTSVGLLRLVLMAILQDVTTYQNLQMPHLQYLMAAMDEVGEGIGFDAWAMSS